MPMYLSIIISSSISMLSIPVSEDLAFESTIELAKISMQIQ